MTKKQLDRFGEVLMAHVRDDSIDFWERMIQGKILSNKGQEIDKQIKGNFNQEQQLIISDLISQVVDTTIHNLLFTIEQEEDIDILVESGESRKSIRELSDGLAGELYTEDGWIIRYSEKKFIEP